MNKTAPLTGDVFLQIANEGNNTRKQVERKRKRTRQEKETSRANGKAVRGEKEEEGSTETAVEQRAL